MDSLTFSELCLLGYDNILCHNLYFPLAGDISLFRCIPTRFGGKTSWLSTIASRDTLNNPC